MSSVHVSYFPYVSYMFLKMLENVEKNMKIKMTL